MKVEANSRSLAGSHPRRSCLKILCAFVCPGFVFAQQGSKSPTGGMTEEQKLLIPSLPVLPWLSVGETKQSQVRAPVQQLISAHQGY